MENDNTMTTLTVSLLGTPSPICPCFYNQQYVEMVKMWNLRTFWKKMPFSCSIKLSYVLSYFSALLRRSLGCCVQSSDPPTHGALPAARCPLPPSPWGSPPISGRHVSRTGSIFWSTISSTSEGQLGKTCKCSRTSPLPFVSPAFNSKGRIPT